MQCSSVLNCRRTKVSFERFGRHHLRSVACALLSCAQIIPSAWTPYRLTYVGLLILANGNHAWGWVWSGSTFSRMPMSGVPRNLSLDMLMHIKSLSRWCFISTFSCNLVSLSLIWLDFCIVRCMDLWSSKVRTQDLRCLAFYLLVFVWISWPCVIHAFSAEDYCEFTCLGIELGYRCWGLDARIELKLHDYDV